jgi:phosphohistidine phosphatase
MPDFVLSSSSVRTLQTMRIVFAGLLREEGLKIASHVDRALYLAPASIIQRQVEWMEDRVNNLLVIAHNPGVGELAQYLGCARRDFPTGALAVFRSDVEHWKDFGPHTARFEGVFTP